MFITKADTSLGCILNYKNSHGQDKHVFIARADQRQILSFGTYFNAVFDTETELKISDDIRSLVNILSDNPYCVSDNINPEWRYKLHPELTSHYLCDRWLERKFCVDAYRTTGVPAVQLCRNTIIPGFGPCDLPNVDIAMRIYAMRNEIDKFELLGRTEKCLSRWSFSDNFANTDFIWTSNEINEVMNIGINRNGIPSLMVKFYRGLVIPIIELD